MRVGSNHVDHTRRKNLVKVYFHNAIDQNILHLKYKLICLEVKWSHPIPNYIDMHRKSKETFQNCNGILKKFRLNFLKVNFYF